MGRIHIMDNREKYVLGIDFGTLSGRALLVNVQTGKELESAVLDYPHAVIDEQLPDGTALGVDWALQHPQDYLDVLSHTIPEVISKSGVKRESIVGLGIDFTACTMLPVKKDGTPLCFIDRFRSNPHAWIKLWKHHAAQPEANLLNAIAEERGDDFLNRYGGKISSEWLLPKIHQILDEAPEIYNEADKFIEAADWVIWQLTGNERRNSCTAGYKGLWNKSKGYPSGDFLEKLDPRLKTLVADKLSESIYPAGTKAGEITAEAAKLTGLLEGTAVAVANVDAHVSVPAVGITSPGKMLAIMGTSTCHMILGEKEEIVPGMCGVVEDGIIEGYYGYEAGQSCVGDHFQWFVENCVPGSYIDEAEATGVNIHELLTKKALKLKPGESGLLALDWWNGNRSVLVDVDLTGMIIGANLNTRPEEIYRALVEATAFGTRMIIETFEEHGVKVDEFYAAGGIAEKNSFMMQIYSDIINRKIRISGSPQAPALGSAMFGAVAAGEKNGGYDTIYDAAEKMAKLKDDIYIPDTNNIQIYNKLYDEYKILHDYFGRGANDVMKRLKNIKKDIKDE